jgi:glycine/D-amino acid oxidase-like deaminating enzyme
MVDAVDSVGRWSRDLDIDCDFVAGGTTSLVRSAIQEHRARASLVDSALTPADKAVWRSADETLQATETLGAVFDPACARLHPAKLVRGLARAAEAAGIRIAEQTEVLRYESGLVTTTRGSVKGDVVIDAMEGYRSQLRQTRRHSLPLYSLMIATEVLPDSVFDAIGLEHGMTFADFRSLVIYGQRTADNRIAFGGRGAPYHWGSQVKPEFDRVPRVFSALHQTLVELFPSLAPYAITHQWGGVLGVPRDWHSSVTLDATTGITNYAKATATQPGFTVGSRNGITGASSRIQDVALYTRALSQSEVQDHTGLIVTYSGNGSNGGTVPAAGIGYSSGNTVTVASDTMTRTN